ncbi:hypothetical protein AS149_25455 [Burkholderia cenocepacia]|nr:hypothetical protein AS149_25455 [Burkholderia cenocepacia]
MRSHCRDKPLELLSARVAVAQLANRAESVRGLQRSARESGLYPVIRVHAAVSLDCFCERIQRFDCRIRTEVVETRFERMRRADGDLTQGDGLYDFLHETLLL